MASKTKDFYKRAHILLILLIFVTFTIIFYIFQLPQKTGSSVARVRKTTCDTSGVAATTVTCTLIAPTNGHTLVATIVTSGTTDSRVSSITQSGATWTRAVQAANATVPTVEIWYTTNLSSASTTLAVNLAASLRAGVIIAEYSGLLSSPLLDKSATSTGSTTGDNPIFRPKTGTTTNTSQSNQLWVAAIGLSLGSIEIFSPTNSFTELDDINSGGTTTGNVRIGFLEKTVTQTGPASTEVKIGDGSAEYIGPSSWAGAIATFNATGAPTQIAFTNSPPTLQAGVCSTAITFETRDSSGAPVYATNGVVIQIISLLGSSNATFYTTSDCSGSNVSSFTFNGAETSKTFYMKDTYASAAHSLTATKISGSDTLTDGTLSYTVTAGSISKLAIRMPGQDAGYGSGQYIGSPSNQTAGISFTITEISARDIYDNVATGYTGAKTITYSGPGNAPNGTAPSYTTSVSFTNGVATTTLTTTLYKAETGITITATEGGLYGQATPTFAVNVGAQADYAMVLSGSTVYVNSCADNTLDITSRDAYQNVRTADASTVLMTSSVTGMLFYPSNSCSGNQNSFSLSSGTVRVYWKPLKSTSSATITATKSGDTPTGTTSAITIYPGPISTLVIKLPGQSFVSGTGITGSVSFPGLRTPNATAGTSFDVVVYAVDEFNNLVDSGVNNYTGQKTLSWAGSTAGNAPSGTAPSYPTTSVTFSNGASPTLTASYYLASSGRNIRADDTIAPINGTVSTSFTVQSNSADNYNVTAPTPQVAGVAFNVTATARDAYNNALGSLYSPPSGTYSWSTTSENAPDNTAPSLGTILANDFTNGTLSKTVTLYKTSSTATFTISEPSPSGVSGTSNVVTVNPGKISASSTDSLILGLAYSAPNSPLTVQVHLKDTWRNPVPNVNKSYITIYGTGSPTIVQPLNNTDSSGIAQGTITWTNTGVYTVTVGINTAELVQNDGSTLDADGLLDAVKSVTVSNTLIPSSILRGGTIINSGTTIR